jgi:putative tryptophan/tyrosine transport system substrate-binding protein
VILRRDFITLVGGATAVWPLAARAQQPVMPVIGFLNSEAPDVFADRVRAFHKGLAETGYVVGQNVRVEYRWAEDHSDRLPTLAADLVHRQVMVIVANGRAAPLAKAATVTIPIVFYAGYDPVPVGLVASLNRPGGNLTGIFSLNVELVPKRLELLREAIPAATDVALLANPINPNTGEPITRDLQVAARTLGLQLHVLNASTERDLDAAFATLPALQARALVIGTDPFFVSRTEQLAALALRYAVPAIFQYRKFAASGGLMSYGSSLTEPFRLVGLYTGRVLKGEKPADLPVQQSTKVELIINLKTANALGLTFPLSLLGRADEVIE